MPANKNQIRRIQTILKMMRQNRYPNYNTFVKEMKKLDIAGVYNISNKTFLRDIADLKDEYGAPIHYDPSRRGFYLSNIDWYNEDLMVEPFEMKAVLLSERVANGILPEPLRSEMNKAVSTLLMKNENGMAEQVELECFQILCPEHLPQVDPDIFLTCYNAWENRQALCLTYHSGNDHVSEKSFEPHLFVWNGGCWYLKGKVYKEDGVYHEDPLIRILALHRIEKAQMLNCKFYPAPKILKSVQEEGLFDFQRLPEVIIEFFNPSARLILEKYGKNPDAIVEQKEKSSVIRFFNITEYEAIQLVLTACGNAKVHTPDQLKLDIRSIAGKILECHTDEPEKNDRHLPERKHILLAGMIPKEKEK